MFQVYRSSRIEREGMAERVFRETMGKMSQIWWKTQTYTFKKVCETETGLIHHNEKFGN